MYFEKNNKTSCACKTMNFYQTSNDESIWWLEKKYPIWKSKPRNLNVLILEMFLVLILLVYRCPLRLLLKSIYKQVLETQPKKKYIDQMHHIETKYQ